MHKINMNVVKRHIFPINKPSIPPEEKSRENQRFSKKKNIEFANDISTRLSAC